MADTTYQNNFPGRIVRWAARMGSILSIAFLILMFIGEGLQSGPGLTLSGRDLAGMLFFPFGVGIGMVLGWRWERLGGGVTVASLAAFYAVLFVMDGRFPRGPWFLAVAAPGFLFLLSWALRKS